MQSMDNSVDEFTGSGLPEELLVVSQITLESATESITIKRVELGNVEQLNTGQSDRANLAGQARPLKQDYWPTIYSLQLRFNNIRPCDNQEVVQFLEDTVGQEIDLTDPSGLVWVGIITTPQAEITENRSHSFALDFEGVKA